MTSYRDEITFKSMLLIRFDLQNYFRHAEVEFIVPNKEQLEFPVLWLIFTRDTFKCIFIRNGVWNEVLIFSDVFTDMSKVDFFLLGEKGSGRVKIALGCEALDSDPQQIRFSHPKLREFIGFYRFLWYDSYGSFWENDYCKVRLWNH